MQINSPVGKRHHPAPELRAGASDYVTPITGGNLSDGPHNRNKQDAIRSRRIGEESSSSEGEQT